MKKLVIILISIISVVSLTACKKARLLLKAIWLRRKKNP